MLQHRGADSRQGLTVKGLQLAYVKTLSHKTNSHYVLTTFFRMGPDWDGCRTILSRFKILNVLAC